MNTNACLSIAVADAHKTVLKHVDMVTSLEGGKAILKAHRLWENI